MAQAQVRTVKAKPAISLERPRLYRVVLINDDYTPMDFVVAILKKYFGFAEDQAVEVMLQVHFQGRGICGVYPREIAESRVFQVNTAARTQEFPLLCVMEPE